MGGSSSKHTVTIYNFMSSNVDGPTLSLAFDGDDGAKLTATDHCYGPTEYGSSSCDLKCLHKNCDVKICEEGIINACMGTKEILEVENIDENYLYFFDYDQYYTSNDKPNERGKNETENHATQETLSRSKTENYLKELLPVGGLFYYAKPS